MLAQELDWTMPKSMLIRRFIGCICFIFCILWKKRKTCCLIHVPTHRFPPMISIFFRGLVVVFFNETSDSQQRRNNQNEFAKTKLREVAKGMQKGWGRHFLSCQPFTKKHRTKTTRNLKDKTHQKNMPGPNSLHLPNFGYAICFVFWFSRFFVLVLFFIFFLLILGCCMQQKWKTLQRQNCKQQAKKQTRTLRFSPSVL